MTSPALAIEQPDGSRLYVHPKTGEAVPSVTTVIAQLAKPKLSGWAARMAAEYATREWESLGELSDYGKKEAIRYAHERERQGSADLGTAVHHAIDCWTKGEPHDHAKDVDPYLNSFTKFLMEKRPRFLRSEVTLWSRAHDYAGTADAIISLDDAIWLIDYKTGKNLYPEVGLQLNALSHADFIINPDGTEEKIPAITAVAAVQIRPRSWHFVPTGYPDENFRAFLAARQLYFWSTEIAEKVLAA